MVKQPVLIKASFFVDTDAFQHLSQWEKALMDFYAAHGLNLERLRVLGAGESDLFYTITKVGMLDKPQSKDLAKKSEASQRLKSAQTSSPIKSAKKSSAPFVKYKDARQSSGFNPGRQIVGKVRKLTMAKFSPQGT